MTMSRPVLLPARDNQSIPFNKNHLANSTMSLTNSNSKKRMAFCNVPSFQPVDLDSESRATRDARTALSNVRSLLRCFGVVLIVMLGVFAFADSSQGQAVSISQKVGGTVRGEIRDMSPDTITVKTDSGTTTVEMSNLRSIVFSNQPVEFGRAANRFSGARYDEGLAELDKMTEAPTDPALLHEFDYQRAFGAAQSATHGGKVTANDAGSTVNAFLTKYPNSYYTWPMRELLGRLLSTIGREDLAQAEYAKMIESTSDEYKLKGTFYVGLSQISKGDGAAAGASMEAVLKSNFTGPEADEIKSRAQALRARAVAITGDTAQAREMAETLIAGQNPENTALFAETYNTLGYCHFQEGNMKSAVLAYLRTDLLFFNQPDAHAEALWYLSQIWPKLDMQEAGWEAQENLKRLYGNSSWAARLGNSGK
jgi:tetratricopeptide (TPR) repeat protein